MTKSTSVDPRKEIWRVRLGSALRTTLACTIVGCTTLYGPATLRYLVEFPAFSYMTTILLVSDATLGQTLRGCWHAFFATLQVMILSILSLWLIGPARFTNSLAAVAVAAGAFVVSLPESTHLMSKRIAFGQIVIVYVGTVVHGAQTGMVMLPIHVASSTALGALASILAMLLPCPRLACLGAICAPDKPTAQDFILQEQPLSAAAAKLLGRMKNIREGMLWESLPIRVFRHNCIDLEEKLQDMEMTMRGMNTALNYCSSFPTGIMDEEIRGALQDFKRQLELKLDRAKSSGTFDAVEPESHKEYPNRSKSCLKSIPRTFQDLPALFFLYCMEFLQENSPFAKNPECGKEKTQETHAPKYSIQRFLEVMNMRNQNLVFAVKCSFSLGLAVLFGLMYSKENGCWSGLAIAISFTMERQATFTVANVRAQGTALGSIYGVLCSFMFHQVSHWRFLALLPWVIFSCFLMHSQMYKQAGGISAVVGALLILGRMQYGPPSQFAITRITEATIGIICFLTMEILLHPSRAATLAKSELFCCLMALEDCVNAIVIGPGQKDVLSSNFPQVIEKQNKLKSHVKQLEMFTIEGQSEPNFWFLPFQGACYSKMLESLSRVADILIFVAFISEHLSQISEKLGAKWVEFHEHVHEDIELSKKKISASLKCLEEMRTINTNSNLEEHVKQKNLPCDIEQGNIQTAGVLAISSGDEEVDSITRSFIQNAVNIADKFGADEDKEMLRSKMVFQYGCLGFCINSLTKETMKIENEVKKLLKLEKSSTNANSYKTLCKNNALQPNTP